MNKVFSNIPPVEFTKIKFTQKIIKSVNLKPNLILRGISENSNEIDIDFGFFALAGSKTHGALYVKDAITKGANLIITDIHGLKIIGEMQLNAAIIIFSEPRKLISEIATYFFTKIPHNIVGITGTNGKTSVAHYIRQFWENLGYNSASIGTTGVNGLINFKTQHTTPDAITLRWYLNQLVKKGVDKIALEASSHGLVQDRLNGIKMSVGVFTNLSRDHYDFHGNINSYFDAKAILFKELVEENGGAAIAIDGPKGDLMLKIAQSRIPKIITVGKKKEAKLRILSQILTDKGQKLKFSWNENEYVIDLKLFGNFQAQNVLLAFACMNLLEKEIQKNKNYAISLLSKLKSVPGRMQEVASKKNGAKIFVDFAHTPDALESVLKSVRSHFIGKIHLIFGAGGNRDIGKRSMMGKIASKLSDHVIITDDNPRFENPSTIRSQIMKFCPKAIEIADRSEAILTGVDQLKNGDALIIAGKGHENFQIYEDNEYPFNDSEEASFAIEALGEKL